MFSKLPDPHKANVQSRFGRVAARYATSEIHAKGESLEALLEQVRPQASWSVVDVATGAGHVAFKFARCTEEVLAVDSTEAMLYQVSEGALARGLRNVRLLAADAELLPISDGVVDAVLCRLALHHFTEPMIALGEFRRVLKPGGILGLTDSITSDDPKAGDYYNAFEKTRDSSHHRVYSLDKLAGLVADAGFEINSIRRFSQKVELEEWAERQGVSADGKAELRRLLESTPNALLPMLAPRTIDEMMFFTLWEAVIVARSTDA